MCRYKAPIGQIVSSLSMGLKMPWPPSVGRRAGEQVTDGVSASATVKADTLYSVAPPVTGKKQTEVGRREEGGEKGSG